MDIRNVQRSGNTYYVYLPASWCRQNNINPDSQISLDMSSEGKLVLSPHTTKKKGECLVLDLPEKDTKILNKFIVASYLNPVRSFKIRLDEEIKPPEILDQKRLLSGIELVEFSEKQITCESSVSVDDPDILLRTMIRKLVNMLYLLINEDNLELVDRYEEEIDRSNILIAKSAISALMFKRTSNLRHVDLYYITVISKNLERIADSLVERDIDKKFLSDILSCMRTLMKVLEKLHYKATIPFAKEVLKLKDKPSKGPKQRIKTDMIRISDILIDWALTIEIDKKAK
ncbi:MAG: hypothetical protein GY861_06340 [bacterium]|nr:hypothetical protein [bacterium]